MSEAPANTIAARPRSGTGIWLDQHLYSLVSSLGRVLQRPWTTLLTIGVMAVALALPLGLGLSLANLQQFAGNVEQSRAMDLFLAPGTSPERAQALAVELRRRSDVASVEVRTPEQGLADLRERSGLGQALDALEENPLPPLLVVTPRGAVPQLASALENLPEAGLLQHDAAWRQRLQGWLGFGQRLAWVLAALFGLGALLVVGNTVRLDIQARREEIGVLQLLGATDGFIRRPFLYLGAWYGAGAGALALGLLVLAGHALRAPVAELAASYGSGFALQGFLPAHAVWVLVGATLLGWLGAGVVTGHFLRQTRPTET